jgi:proteic killer suppression protein
MILTFKDKSTRILYAGGRPKGFPADVAAAAYRKLQRLDVAREVLELASPPGNRLEQLRGDRQGQWSIRINDQWRLCFRWTSEGAEDVEVCDYH